MSQITPAGPDIPRRLLNWLVTTLVDIDMWVRDKYEQYTKPDPVLDRSEYDTTPSLRGGNGDDGKPNEGHEIETLGGDEHTVDDSRDLERQNPQQDGDTAVALPAPLAPPKSRWGRF